MVEITTKSIEKILKDKGYKDFTSSGNVIKLKVNADRYDTMETLVKLMKNLGAIHDPNAAGSSIGAIKIGKVKILIKSAGRTRWIRC